MTSPFDLSGRTALVTGSSRGLGRAMAEGLAAAGASIILNGADAGRLSEAVAAMNVAGHKARGLNFDATDEQAVVAAFAALDARNRTETARAGRDARMAKLTQREREILDLVAEGLSTKEIARALDVSPRTVETHRAHIAEKLGAGSVAEMVRFALEG